MISIGIRVDFGQAVQQLRAMRQAMQPPLHPEMRAAFHRVADHYDAYIGDRADRVGQSGGVGEWKPLAPSTAAEKKRKGYPPTILVRTRAMRVSYQGGPNHVRQNLPNGVRTGSKDPKIARHQRGGGKLPQREVYVPPHPQFIRSKALPELTAAMRKILMAVNAAAPRVPGVSQPPSNN